MNFSKYLIYARMEAAKDLLKSSDDKIETIAKNVGYNDLKTFTKNFSKHTGLKPSEYRRLYG
ncbi:HTH-type transcriptional regulator YesS [Lachnospiraceae bacterium]|nr:HTH-type transcriptional regulator YesS [Lachnospiraceae bacterium]